MATLTLSKLHIYPIKSAAGIALNEAIMTARGLQYDRRWMVVDADGKFMTQRKYPQMALISVEISVEISDRLKITAPEMPELSVPLVSKSDERLAVEVWGDKCEAIALGPESKQWFTQFMSVDCQLVYMPDDSHRPAAHGTIKDARGDDKPVSFADAYPYLLISEASLAGLNQRLSEKGEMAITMARFRPNLVIQGCKEAHEEDAWQQIQIGKAVFDLPKLCDRCSIPSVNPQTGIQGKEPTKTLATYRYWDKGIWFGQNCVQADAHKADQAVMRLRVGDSVEILK